MRRPISIATRDPWRYLRVLLLMNSAWPWVTLALLGAYHGLNPAMGWLFAVALGVQQKSGRAVVAALGPIAAGHAIAITLTILLFRLVQGFFSLHILKLAVAGILLATGLYRLFRAGHPRGGGMRVGWKDLFLWSFLMASSHGAGLMLMPVLLSTPMLGMQSGGMSHLTMTGAMAGATPQGSTALSITVIGLAVVVHMASLLAVAGLVALLVYETYETVGLSVLRNSWVNFDLLWAIALILAGCAAVLL
ncbi:MAG: hypothetical protein WBW31_05310 [Candidatus Sulfotelmatobacter sp.]